MEKAFEKLTAAKAESKLTYEGGNESNLVEVPLENLYISYARTLLSKTIPTQPYLAYILKDETEQCSYSIHFLLDFKNSVSEVSNTHLLVNPDTPIFLLKQDKETAQSKDDFERKAMASFQELTRLENGVPVGITKDLSSGASHSKNFRFSLSKFTVDYLAS